MHTISLDTETTGMDFYHGSRPFFVTTCMEDGTQRWWEWGVDPLTRRVTVPAEDITAIQDLLAKAERVIGQNIKFDATGLRLADVIPEWPWDKTEETTIQAHLLASNRPKDLTALTITYLGWDITPYEVALREAVRKARAWVSRRDFVEEHDNWRIAKDGDPMLPSGGGVGADYWLPRAVTLTDPDAPKEWATVLRDYANMDSAATIAVYLVMAEEIRRLKRTKLYETERRKPYVASVMERNGLTFSLIARDAMRTKIDMEKLWYEARCHEVARQYRYPLELPKGAVNNSLRRFCFQVLNLPPVVNPKAKTTNPSLDAKTAIPYYLLMLPEDSDGGRFIRAMVGKRARDTALSFLASWDGYSVQAPHLPKDFRLLHPSFNPATTDTTRYSSNNPNAQQIGKKDVDAAGIPIVVLRGAFGPAPGREWWSLDFANIELRIPAYLSGEPLLISLFEAASEPPFYGSEHLLNFSIVYPDLWEDAVKKVGLDKAGPYVKETYKGSWYKDCKNGDFAVQYQAGDATADATFKRPGSRARLRERFARKEAVVAETLRFAEKHGYIETLPDRTVDADHGYPLLTMRMEYGKVKPTLPFSYKIQGTAGWVGNRAAELVLNQLEDWNHEAGKNDYRLIAYVHDELLFDFPKRAHPKKDPRRSNLGRIRAIQRLMISKGEDLIPRIPLGVSVEYHEVSWGEGVAI